MKHNRLSSLFYCFIACFVFSALMLLVGWGAGMVFCLERGADLHMAQLMSLPLTVSCFSEVQIGFTFLLLAHPGSPGKMELNVCVCVLFFVLILCFLHESGLASFLPLSLFSTSFTPSVH